MRLTVLAQYAQGLGHCDAGWGEERREQRARFPWSLWHGNRYKARDNSDALEASLSNCEETSPKCKPWLQAVEECRTSIVHTAPLMPHSGERYRQGEAIATGLVESTVHQVVRKRCCKTQQLPWSKRGAHWLLQTRLKTLHHALGTVFKHWYPDMEVEELPDAA